MFPWPHIILWVSQECVLKASPHLEFPQPPLIPLPSLAGSENIPETGVLRHLPEVSFERVPLPNVRLQIPWALQHQSAHHVCGLEQHQATAVSFVQLEMERKMSLNPNYMLKRNSRVKKMLQIQAARCCNQTPQDTVIVRDADTVDCGEKPFYYPTSPQPLDVNRRSIDCCVAAEIHASSLLVQVVSDTWWHERPLPAPADVSAYVTVPKVISVY